MRKSFIILIISVLMVSCKDQKRHHVVSKVQSTCSLATTETIIDKVVVGYKTKRTFFGLVGLGEATYLANANAIVKTGIRLEDIRPQDVKIEGKRIELYLPPVSVLDFNYPFDSVKVNEFASRNKLFNKIDIQSEENFHRLAEKDIRNNLLHTGIVQQTQENTRKMLMSMLTQLGYEEVYIRFKEPKQLIQHIEIAKSDIEDE